jgi:hypothetical protein
MKVRTTILATAFFLAGAGPLAAQQSRQATDICGNDWNDLNRLTNLFYQDRQNDGLIKYELDKANDALNAAVEAYRQAGPPLPGLPIGEASPDLERLRNAVVDAAAKKTEANARLVAVLQSESRKKDEIKAAEAAYARCVRLRGFSAYDPRGHLRSPIDVKPLTQEEIDHDTDELLRQRQRETGSQPPATPTSTGSDNPQQPAAPGGTGTGVTGINPLGGDVLPPQPPGPATTPPAAGAPGAPGTPRSCPAGTQDITCTLKYGSESGCLSSQVDIDDLRKRCARNGGTITTGPAPPPAAPAPVAMKPSTLLPPPALPGAKTKTDSSGLLQPPALPPAASRPEPKTVQQQPPRARTRSRTGGGQGPDYDPPPDVDWEGLGRELGRALGGGGGGGGGDEEGHHHE